MKIGILIKDFEKLTNWELRIINSIINNPELELSLLIKDGRKGDESPKSRKSKIQRILKSKNILGTALFKIQVFIERKVFKEDLSVDKQEIIEKLKATETIYTKPNSKGFLDIFSNEEGEKIKGYNLDIILRHEFRIIRGAVLSAAKYGIWSFHHADNSINRGGPSGLWEIILNQPAVGVTLQQLTPELDGGLVIDKAFINRHWSFIKSDTEISEASVSLLLKNIRLLQQGIFSPEKSMVYYNPLYKIPKPKYLLKYMINFYSIFLGKIIERINYKLFGTRYECWTLFIGKGDFMYATLFRLKPVKMPKNEFWADPFIINYKDDNYIFFENYEYSRRKGKICCGKVKDNQLVDVRDVLNFDYHLSFPYVFEENGDIFLMPESEEANRLELYKCINFPDEWELYSTAFEGERVADAFFYNDDDGQKWLFINKQADVNSPMNTELFIYKADSLQMNHLEPHTKNPVLIDSTTARNAGSIFKLQDERYRPSQANIDGIYGRALNINRIEKLTIDEYVENTIVTVYPNFHEGLMSVHHLHQYNGMFVIDAAYKKK